MLKILITGASGFVGQHLLEDIDPGRFDVTVISREPAKKMRVLPNGVKVLQADLNDADSLIKAFAGIDVLINTAAEVRNVEKLEQTNVQGTKNLIRAITENKISKVIHLSSVGVVGMQYSSKAKRIDELAACDPKNEYERTKLESEKLLKHASAEQGFDLVILRPTNVFGEYHPFNALLNMMKHVAAEKPVVLSSGAIVNYVYVKDLSGAILSCLDNGKMKGTFNVGEALSLDVFTSMIAEQLNAKKKIIRVPGFLINFIDALGWRKLNAVSNKVEYDDSALKNVFQYPYGIKKGLERTIEYYKKKGMIK